MDLTQLLEERVHLTGFDCKLLRGLRLIKGAVEVLPIPGSLKVEWWEHSNSNPAQVKCLDCWQENASVQHAYAKQRRK